MRAVFASFLMMFSLCGVAAEGTYLDCTGHSGTSPMQDLIPLLSRTITANEGPEKGSIFIGTDKIAVEGIPWMMGEYKLCENSDQVILFSPACDRSNPDRFTNLGILNKVTGDVRYHVGESLFILKCRKAIKVVK
jgi:hypothetical protein